MSKRSSIFGRLGLRGRPNGDDAPPPAYDGLSTSSTSPQPQLQQGQTPATEEEADLTAAFESLNLSDAGSQPTADTCLAHLKLLLAFQTLKEDVGYTDGLFGLWDSLAGPIIVDEEKRRLAGAEHDKTLATLSRIREKRWALFVARASDRYEAWWKGIPGQRILSERDMSEPERDQNAYSNFPTDPNLKFGWTENILPPLDVLMVWHTHMLNPRAFLEDAMLVGLRSFWSNGMPWALVDRVIDPETFSYRVSDQCKANWTKQTGHAWDVADDSPRKTLLCPRCNTSLEILWTACGLPENHCPNPNTEIDLIGEGYGDGNLSSDCPQCGITIRKELLSVARFVKDVTALMGHSNKPMHGTILDTRSGIPELPDQTSVALKLRVPRTFPNAMLKSGCDSIRTDIMTLLHKPLIPGPTMEDVRRKIEYVLSRPSNVKEISGFKAGSASKYALRPGSRTAIRKMMNTYWQNFSPFGLDLSGAVMRQGIFVEKMVKLDWLHSPSARQTMERLIVKYNRFLAIMAENPDNVVVPTLDVDLAWHTHQLSPGMYYQHTVSLTGKFVDHDDKIEEGVLSAQFEWTSQKYQEKYGEVYSECTCWYCEAIRSSHVSGLSGALGVSKHERMADNFHSSGRAALCPPDKSAHISAHNAVMPTEDYRQTVRKRLVAVHQKRLDAAYAKAKARAEKKGRKIPPREAYVYDHWGHPVTQTGPYGHPMWWTAGMYFAWAPGAMMAGGCGGGGGDWGGCAAPGVGDGGFTGNCGGNGGCDGGVGGGSGACGGVGCGGGGCGGGGGDGGGGGGGGCGGGGGGCGGGGGS
ncbi:uncharacterized protein QC761_100410 [Podospora bellae-mahoneyi]|uniref:Glycine-rich domain-containing protein 1 n=1 Tax=Podospora bellae-mahoneyi TaxID=2093777 RepID=A0ABR0FSQ2_9PEZI|nr:hypothetical protein QC761_100410 [Podospora bellae-mahoneyi]